MSDLSRRYQEFNGGRTGEAYRVEGPNGEVNFDAYDGNSLIDSKGHYEQFFRDGEPRAWWGGAEELLDQANDQVAAAGETPIEWRFLEREPARYYQDLFEDAGVPIRVRHVPIEGD